MQPPPRSPLHFLVVLAPRFPTVKPAGKNLRLITFRKKKRKEAKFNIEVSKKLGLPVVNSGRVGLRVIEVVSSDGFGGEVAAGVEDAPPHVVLPRRRRARRRRTRRHRQRFLVLAAACSLHSDI